MNRLAGEASPYLLQHANNPVDWYPWCDEAFERAKREDKPVLLSIGYAACHWCHVMEHESFENPAIAAVMNEHFINIKVDREERPDIDSIYMQAVQAMTGHGGWPMTTFLTPDGEPFYGGTYFPPVDRHGMPGFPRLLRALAGAWANDRAGVLRTSAQVREMFSAASRPAGGGEVTPSTMERAFRTLAQQFDEAHAGFGGAPKFPPSMSLEFLLTHWARTGQPLALEMTRRTFSAMSRGGITDHVGGGIHRYSVDERWLVPHFEKMLYDNALFIRLGVHLWQATHDPEVRRSTRAAIRWVAREMTAPEGGFYSSLDADSEGQEGKFYVWSAPELDELLGDDAAVVRAAWGVSRDGNFEGHNILWLPHDIPAVARRLDIAAEDVEAALGRSVDILYKARARRVWPALDDKILASWNGLMLRALIEAARAFGEPDLLALAVRNARFVADTLTSGGRVYRSWRQGKRLDVGFLEDHAAVALAFLDLFAETGTREWIDRAREITRHIVTAFHDEATGLFFDTSADHQALIARPRDTTDNAIPSGSSLTAELLLRLAVFDDDARYRHFGEAMVCDLAESLGRYPLAVGHLLGAADLVVHGAVEVAVPAELSVLRAGLADRYIPSLVVSCDAEVTALTRGKLVAGERRAFVCRRYQCEAPTANPDVFADQLGRVVRRA